MLEAATADQLVGQQDSPEVGVLAGALIGNQLWSVESVFGGEVREKRGGRKRQQ